MSTINCTALFSNDVQTFILKKNTPHVTTGVGLEQEVVFAASCRCNCGDTLQRMRTPELGKGIRREVTFV